MIYYPAFLNLKNKKVLLFGGGEIALRKAKSLVTCGTKLTVISRDFSDSFKRFANLKKIELKKGSHIPKRLEHFSLVVAATSDPSFNRLLSQACTAKRIWVNVVDDPKNSSFIVPSVVKRGSLQVAISTGGASPALAKLLRKKFETELGPRYAQLARFLGKQRNKIKKTISNSKDRQKYFYKLVQSKLKKINQ